MNTIGISVKLTGAKKTKHNNASIVVKLVSIVRRRFNFMDY